MFWMLVCAAHMGGFLTLNFSKHGYNFSQIPIQQGGKLEKTSLYLSQDNNNIASKMFVVQFQAMKWPRKLYFSHIPLVIIDNIGFMPSLCLHYK